jgi:hypothetical protein
MIVYNYMTMNMGSTSTKKQNVKIVGKSLDDRAGPDTTRSVR